MRLIKINTEHYVVVDYSEIKEGDWFLPISGIGWELNKPRQADNSGGYTNGHCRKITHSTQPIEYIEDKDEFGTHKVQGFDKIQYLPIQEVKELIGEVDVVKKAEEIYLKYDNNQYLYGDSLDMQLSYKAGVVDGYNQALEDNKENKYTEDDMRKAYMVGQHGGVTQTYYEFDEYIQQLQPKTEWEVEIVDGKLKLK